MISFRSTAQFSHSQGSPFYLRSASILLLCLIALTTFSLPTPVHGFSKKHSPPSNFLAVMEHAYMHEGGIVSHVGRRRSGRSEPLYATDSNAAARFDKMPDRNNFETKMTLKCNSCIAISHEVFLRLYRLVTSRERYGGGNANNSPAPSSDVQYFEWVEGLDKACEIVKVYYGLAVDDDETPTLFFRSDRESTRLITGGWVEQMLAERCARLTERFEDKIIRFMESSVIPSSQSFSTSRLSEEARKAVEAAKHHFMYRLCLELDKSCNAIEPPAASNTAATVTKKTTTVVAADQEILKNTERASKGSLSGKVTTHKEKKTVKKQRNQKSTKKETDDGAPKKESVQKNPPSQMLTKKIPRSLPTNRVASRPLNQPNDEL